MVALAGGSIPLVFLIGALAVGATGSTFAQFSRMMPSAGSFVTFISRATSPKIGLAVGVTALVSYIITFAGIYVFVGTFVVHEILDDPDRRCAARAHKTILIGVFVILPVVLGLQFGIKVSAAMYLFEVAVLAAITAAILFSGGDHGLSTDPFTFSDVGLKGVGLALAIAITVYIGFKAPAPLAEETETRGATCRSQSSSVSRSAESYSWYPAMRSCLRFRPQRPSRAALLP